MSMNSRHHILVEKREVFVINHSENSKCWGKEVRAFIVFAPSNTGMKTYSRTTGPRSYKGSLHGHLKTGLQMPLDPLELLSAERENFPLLLKCRIRFAIQMSGAYDWKHTAAKRHLMNWRRKKNRGRNKRKVKEVVIVFLKKAFKIHLVNFWPPLSSSCLPSQTLARPLYSWPSCSVPTFLSSLCPRVWTPPWQQAHEGLTGVLWPLCKIAPLSFFKDRICQVLKVILLWHCQTDRMHLAGEQGSEWN